MGTKKWNFPGRELPAYLGYGILDEQSVVFKNDTLKADYVLECDGSVVHSVNWGKDSCSLQTEFHGKRFGLSQYTDLNKALTFDFMSRDMAKDQLFGFLSMASSRMGNIYVKQPSSKLNGKPLTIFYPAGLLLNFRLPVPLRNEAYISFLEKIKNSDYVRLRRERVAWLLLADLSYEVTYQPVVMADFIVPLAYMTMASWLFAEAGIISPKKQFRLMVSESFQTETLMLHTFTGDISTPFFGYYYGDTPPDNKPYLESIFSAALKRQPLPKE